MCEAFLCGSGSLALEMVLGACGVGRGAEVIVPAFCCSAIVLPVLAVGATPVLADVGEELNVTAATVDAALTRKTRAVIVPHLFGNPADIGAIVDLVRGRNVRVIDDAAQALGATIHGRPAGSLGDAGILSFGREKICSGLGGGAAVSAHEGVLPKSMSHGLVRPRAVAALGKMASTLLFRRGRRWMIPIQRAVCGKSSRSPDEVPERYEREAMTNLAAAVAASLLSTLREHIAERRVRLNAYRELLGGLEGLQLIPHRAGSACLVQVVGIAPPSRNHDLGVEVIRALGAAGYEVRGSYLPIHLLAGYPQCVWDRLPNVERVWADLIELPCDPALRLKDVERIADVVKKTISNRGRWSRLRGSKSRFGWPQKDATS